MHVYDRGVTGKIKTTNMLMAETETQLVQPRSPIGDEWEAEKRSNAGENCTSKLENPLIRARISGNLCFCLQQL